LGDKSNVLLYLLIEQLPSPHLSSEFPSSVLALCPVRCVDATHELLWDFWSTASSLLDKELSPQPADVSEILSKLREIRDDATPIIGIAQGITNRREALTAFAEKMEELS
jgi:hypothetical protein